MISDALKKNLTPEILAKLIDDNTRTDTLVDYWGLVTSFELFIMDTAFDWAEGHQVKAADNLVMGRTTFLQKRKKYRGQ